MRRVCPASSVVSVRLALVAPEMLEHSAPMLLHRCHW
jgi:hypothetical protein